MKSEKIVSKWYDITGEKCLKVYKKSQDNEIIQLPRLLEKIPKDSKILDAGCGNGKPVAKFLSEKGYDVIGIDISKKLIKEAQKNSPTKSYLKELRIIYLYTPWACTANPGLHILQNFINFFLSDFV